MFIEPLDKVNSQIEIYRKDVEAVLLYTKKLEVTNRREAKVSINYIARARSLSEQITQTKLSITKEARAYVSKINNLAKEFVESLALVEDMIVKKIDSWKMESNSNHQEDIMEDDICLVDTFESNEKIISDEATAYEEIEYLYEIEDISKVPVQYLSVNQEQFDLSMKNGIRHIPGLKITENLVTKVRRNGKR